MTQSIKTLVLDGDGVVLDFYSAYKFYLIEVHNMYPANDGYPTHFNMRDLYPTHPEPWVHIPDFNASYEHFSQVKPLYNADKVLSKIRRSNRFERIVMLTSCGNSAVTVRARNECVERNFPGVFDEIIYLPLSHSKLLSFAEIKDKYGESVVVDDLPDNCISAAKHGHKPFLFHQKHNRHFHNAHASSSGFTKIFSLSQLGFL